jgi:hypothetical protein
VRKSPCSLHPLPRSLAAILATVRQCLGKIWAPWVFLSCPKGVQSPGALTDLEQALGEAFVSQPCVPLILVVSHSIYAVASITPNTSEPCPVSSGSTGHRICQLPGACGTHWSSHPAQCDHSWLQWGMFPMLCSLPS